LQCMSPLVALSGDLLRCENSDAIGPKRTLQ